MSNGASLDNTLQVGGALYANQQNIQAASDLNEETREWQDYWNYKNREWFKRDREYMNAYNSPMQQMQRLREAGLNPNLIYGKFEAGNMGSLRTPEGKTSNLSSYRVENPFQGITPVQDYYRLQGDKQQIKMGNLQIREQQMKNSIEMNNVVRDNMLLGYQMRGFDKENHAYKGQQGYYEAKIQGDIASAQNEVLKMNLNKIKVETETKLAEKDVRTLQEFEKLTALQLENAKTPVEKDYLQKRLDILKNEEEVSKFKARLAKMGVPENSPYYVIMGMQLIDDAITPDN